jgi:hypothetical protein
MLRNRCSCNSYEANGHRSLCHTKLRLGRGGRRGLCVSAIKNRVDIADIHATMLALFGIDHEALTFPLRGADQGLTPLTRQARVITDIMA